MTAFRPTAETSSITSSTQERSMMKLIACAIVVLMAMTGVDRQALAQVPGGGAEVLCQLVDGPIVDIQDGGTFPLSPVSCGIEAFAQASIAVQPFTGLFAQADAEDEEPNAHGSAAMALAALQYDFTVTGGQVGDLVPVLVLTRMETQASTSDFPNDSNIASALIDVRALSPVSGVQSEDGAGACDVSPGKCTQPPTVRPVLSITMASGSVGRVFMQVLVTASALSGGFVFASIDPFIFVDPSFANAADYTITVDSRVGNELPAVPAVFEPGTWALLLAGLAGLRAAGRRRSPCFTIVR